MKDDSFRSRYHKKEAPYDFVSMGMVIDFNPATALCTVKLDKGGFVRNVPVLGMYGAQHGTDLSTTGSLRGAVVVLIKVYSQLYVLNTVPTQLSSGFKVSEDSVTPGYGGGDPNTYDKGVDLDKTAMRTTDYLPGDKIERAEGGAESSLFKEGLAVFKASALCQFSLNKVKDLGRMVTRVYQHFTDFGEVNYTHSESGRVGMNIKGGAEFLDETHPTKANWTVQVWVGDNPDNDKDRLFVKVNDKDQSELVTLSVDIDGNIKTFASKDTLVRSERDIELSAGEDLQLLAEDNMSIKADGKGQFYTKGRLLIKSDTSIIIKGPSRTIRL